LERNLYLDVAKVVSAILVVGLHCALLFDISDLGYSLLVNGVFRFAVPFFLIVNGYYFFKVNDEYIKNWFKRVISLYFFWMLAYSYYWIDTGAFSPMDALRLFKTLIVGYFHLWYVAAMFLAAALLMLAKRLSDLWLFSLSITLFIAGFLLQFAGNYQLFSDYPLINRLLNKYIIYRNFLFFAFPFFSLGYLISKAHLEQLFSYGTLLVIFGLGAVLLIAESYLNFYNLGTSASSDIMLSLVICCPSFLLILLKSSQKTKSKILTKLSSVIFFVHPFFLLLSYKIDGLSTIERTLAVLSLSVLCYPLLDIASKRLRFIL